MARTGSGKTLAAFLASIDRLGRRAEQGAPGVRVLYISPLKALVYDIERNLRVPLAGIAAAAEAAAEVLGDGTDAEAGREGTVALGPAKASATPGAAFRPPRLGIRTPSPSLISAPTRPY